MYLTANSKYSLPLPVAVILCHSSDERETLVFEDRTCPVALETLLSHIERDKSGGSAKGSDHSALQRWVRALLMPGILRLRICHQQLQADLRAVFHILTHERQDNEIYSFSSFIIVSFAQLYRRVAWRCCRKNSNYSRQQSAKEPWTQEAQSTRVPAKRLRTFARK